MAWDPEVPGCFGGVDLLFAIHPLDEKRAFAWLTSLRRRKATLAKAEKQVRSYLANQSCGEDHIREQVMSMHRHFGAWLS
jgi:hypothetical protein